MNASLSRFVSLPMPLKVGLLALSGGSLVGVTHLLFPEYRWLLLIGVAVVALLVAGFVLMWRALEKRKARQMDSEVGGSAGKMPSDISEPERRARLDELRRQFEGGVTKFREAGKDLYSLPWYVLVGEPGSGKTEAIRHCNVGFPPGLQDAQQGAGGTINMNWWFTNHAVILDTAGRLMFEEVPAGTTGEWEEFLRLLRRNRPNAPVNGMLLVIPADSLIKDSAEQIESKAGTIAQQLDQIQRTLGVRFPVFVMITKADLITGFREFFDHLEDPQLQHQILGWSNPASLDEPFDPGEVERHLEEVKGRLERRRLGLLVGSRDRRGGAGEAQSGGEIDALYALPEALMKIAPRLRRYLEMIFVPGEWSSRPLFLRGIYFTSSMSEGAALDEELAEALGQPVENLPAGRVFERDKAYFLRDLFMKKVFQEKGLVTRATNTRRLQRQRRAAVLGFGLTAVVLLMGVTWFSARSFDQSIRQHAVFWSALESAYSSASQPVILRQGTDGRWVYRGEEEVEAVAEANLAGDLDSRLGRLHASAWPRVQAELQTPLIFRPARWLTQPVGDRLGAFSRTYELGVLRPVLDASREAFLQREAEAGAWSPEAGQALLELVRLELLSESSAAPGEAAARVETEEEGAFIRLRPLFEQVLPSSQYQVFEADAEALQEAADRLRWVNDSGEASPPATLGVGSGQARAAIEAGYEQLLAHMSGTMADLSQAADEEEGMLLELAERLGEALGRLESAEQELWTLNEEFPREADEPLDRAGHDAVAARWLEVMEQVLASRDEVDAALASVEAAYGEGVEASALLGEAERQMLGMLQPAIDPLRRMLDASVEAGEIGEGHYLFELRGRLARDWERFEQQVSDRASEARQTLERLKDAYLAEGPGGRRLYALRSAMYELADEPLRWVVGWSAPEWLAGLSGSLESFDTLHEQSSGEIERLGELLGSVEQGEEAADQAVAISDFGLRLAGRDGTSRFLEEALDLMPASASAWEELVASRMRELIADDDEVDVSRPRVPETPSAEMRLFEHGFHPSGAGPLLEAAAGVSSRLGSGQVLDASELERRWGGALEAMRAYLERYRSYWAEQVRRESEPAFGTWRELVEALPDLDVTRLNEDLSQVHRWQAEALGAVEGVYERSGRWSEDLETLRRAREQALGFVDLLVLDGFRADARLTLESWRELGADAPRALDRLGELRPRDLMSNHFAAYSEQEGVPFWNALSEQALRLLVEAGQDQISSTLANLAEKRGIPLYRPSAGESARVLSADEVAEALELMERLPVVRLDDRGTRLAEGGLTDRRSIDEQLERVFGPAAVDDSHRAWLERVGSLLEALADSETGELGLRAEVVILPLDAQSDLDEEPAVRHLRAMEVWVGDDRVGDRFNADRFESETGIRLRLPLAAGEDAEVVMYQTLGQRRDDGDRLRGRALLEGPWAGLAELASAKRWEEDEGVWKLPLRVELEGRDGVLGYWLGLRFDREIPPVRDWPGEADWPAF